MGLPPKGPQTGAGGSKLDDDDSDSSIVPLGQPASDTEPGGFSGLAVVPGMPGPAPPASPPRNPPPPARSSASEAYSTVQEPARGTVFVDRSGGGGGGGGPDKTRRSMLYGEEKNNSSWAGRLEETPAFQNSALAVIVVNAIWIFVDTQWNHKRLARPYPDGKLPLEPYSIVIENLFCTYFTIEVLIRFIAYKKKIFAVKDPWYIFDSTLVGLMVLETWIMPLASEISKSDRGGGANTGMFSSMRLLRLLRLTRMARLMRFFPELMTLVKGMFSAAQAVGFILLFLVIVTYIFAILFTVQLGEPGGAEGEGDEETAAMLFSDLGSSMMTLFTNGVLGDNLYETLVTIRAESVELMWVFILFFFISSMTLLNMLIGVLCAVIEETTKSETEARQLYDLKTILRKAFDVVDQSHDGTISNEEFYEMRNDAGVREMFEGLGVDPSNMDKRLDQLQETVFGQTRLTVIEQGRGEKGQGLGFDDFMERVIELKWGTPASALDLEILRAQVMTDSKDVRQRLIELETSMDDVCRLGTPNLVEKPWKDQSAAKTSLQEVPTELLLHALKTRSAEKS